MEKRLELVMPLTFRDTVGLPVLSYQVFVLSYQVFVCQP